MSSLKRSYNYDNDDINDVDDIDDIMNKVERSSKIAKYEYDNRTYTNAEIIIWNRFIQRFCHHSSYCNNLSPNHNYYCELHQPETFDMNNVYIDIYNHKMRAESTALSFHYECLKTDSMYTKIRTKMACILTLYNARWMFFISKYDKIIRTLIKSLQHFEEKYNYELSTYIDTLILELKEYEEMKKEMGIDE